MSLDYFAVADRIRTNPDDGQLRRATLEAASPDARRQYVEAVATYRDMCAVRQAVRDIDANPAKRKAIIARADALQRADIVAVLKSNGIHRVTRERATRREWLERATPAQIGHIRTFYSAHIADFINDWGSSLNPKLATKGEAIQPLLLWPAQIKFIEMIWEAYRNQEPMIVCKARDVGASYCSMAAMVALALFTPQGFVGLVGSATEDKVDGVGDSNTLFAKVREILEYTPVQLRGGYTLERCSSDKKILVPETGALIRGGVGANIGRGGRSSLVVIDEAAHVPFATEVYQALAANTDAVVSLSSVRGTDSKFYEMWQNPAIRLKLHFPWTADPRKVAEPDFAKRMMGIVGRVTFAQEYACDFLADSTDTILPGAHVEFCVDGDKRAGVKCVGEISIAFDIGVSKDRSAVAVAHGTRVIHAESWASQPDKLTPSVRRVVELCDKYGAPSFWYDVSGAGGFVPSSLAAINEQRVEQGRPVITGLPFDGGGALYLPESAIPGWVYVPHSAPIKNEDRFYNLKSQSWGWLEYLAGNTALLAEGEAPDPSECLFIAGDIPELGRLKIELAQPRWYRRPNGTLLVDKYAGNMSPNLSDAVMMALHPRAKPMRISDDAMAMLCGPNLGGNYASFQ
jgi:phage terminase large subunit